jgi:hypothetical protein
MIAFIDMGAEKESDETKTKNDYIPGKSLNLLSTSNVVTFLLLNIRYGVRLYAKFCVGCRV